MTNGMPFCSATCAIASDWPESKAPTRQLRAVADHFRGARARRLDTRFGVAVHDRKVRQTHRFQDRRRNSDAALAILADASLKARPRQQHADLQRAVLRAHDCGGGDGGGGRGGNRDSELPACDGGDRD